MQQLSNRILTARKNLSYIFPDSVKKDPLTLHTVTMVLAYHGGGLGKGGEAVIGINLCNAESASVRG